VPALAGSVSRWRAGCSSRLPLFPNSVSPKPTLRPLACSPINRPVMQYHPGVLCALFSNQPMGFYSPTRWTRRRASRHQDLCPDVNVSDVWCTVEHTAVRVGPVRTRMERQFAPRWSKSANGAELRGLGTLCGGAPPRLSRSAIEHLCGSAAATASVSPGESCCGQVGLCSTKNDGADTELRRSTSFHSVHPTRAPVLGLADDDGCSAEYQVLGFGASEHPLSLLRDVLPPRAVRSDRLKELETARASKCGLVVAPAAPDRQGNLSSC